MNIDEWLEALQLLQATVETEDGWYSTKEIREGLHLSRYNADRLIVLALEAGLMEHQDGYRLNRIKRKQFTPVYRLVPNGDDDGD